MPTSRSIQRELDALKKAAESTEPLAEVPSRALSGINQKEIRTKTDASPAEPGEA